MIRPIAIFCTLFTTALFAKTPYLSIENPKGVLSERMWITVKEASPQQTIELVAETEDSEGEIWSSHATFAADDKGEVYIPLAKPLENSSYDVPETMGLFWSMLPSSGDTTAIFQCKDDTFACTISLYADGKLLDQKNTVRYLKTPDVKRVDVREKGLVGTLFIPKSDHPLPVMVTLSGSNGRLPETRAKLLASNGYAALALGYFGVEGLPPHLENIPLEYFETAFEWLKNHPDVDGSRIGLFGVSRGAELALILGALFPDSISAIVTTAPSCVIYGGLTEHPSHAWLYHGEPLAPPAPVTSLDLTDGKGQTADYPISTRENFIEGMRDVTAYQAAQIPLKKIRAPIFLAVGKDDQVWPSYLYYEQIREQLRGTPPMFSIYYQYAGHGITIPNLPSPDPTYYHPVAKLWFAMGGTRASNAIASSYNWLEMLRFLDERLMGNIPND